MCAQMHAGLPVEAGEKWACNLWFRERETTSGGAAKRRMLTQQHLVGQEVGEESSGVGGAAQSDGTEASAAEATSTPSGSSKAQELPEAAEQHSTVRNAGSEAAAVVDATASAAPAPAPATGAATGTAQASPVDAEPVASLQ
jgi:hypothetical protein